MNFHTQNAVLFHFFIEKMIEWNFWVLRVKCTFCLHKYDVNDFSLNYFKLTFSYESGCKLSFPMILWHNAWYTYISEYYLFIVECFRKSWFHVCRYVTLPIMTILVYLIYTLSTPKSSFFANTYPVIQHILLLPTTTPQWGNDCNIYVLTPNLKRTIY